MCVIENRRVDMKMPPLWRKIVAILIVYWDLALEYRVVILVWIMATSIPLVMMAVWASLAATGPIGGYSQGDFIAYYMANLLITHLVTVWHGWELSNHIRLGELNPLLLKPFHPLWVYGLRALPAKPLRLPIYLPPIILVTWLLPGVHYNLRPMALLVLLASMALAYALTFFMQTCVALLAFWISQAGSLVGIWYQLRILFGGYLVPISLFPPAIATAIRWLPFRFTLSLPLEIVTGKLPPDQWGFALMAALAWNVLFFALMHVLWRLGLRTYSAVGA